MSTGACIRSVTIWPSSINSPNIVPHLITAPPTLTFRSHRTEQEVAVSYIHANRSPPRSLAGSFPYALPSSKTVIAALVFLNCIAAHSNCASIPLDSAH
jgi:hypothetical protein